jgi:3-hydroxyisobutyrate dehydrogenase-like beta-hydroxyacid dehydrogenase
MSLVTADQATLAASSVAASLKPGAIFIDGNSVSPMTKRLNASLIEGGDGSYIDMAIMAPVDPAGLSVPMLLSGQAAEDAAEHLRQLGFSNVRVVGAEVGLASAIKMVRSIMVKGLEALTAEMVMAGARAGVLDEVLSSLGSHWEARVNYNLDRMLVHGGRRAAELEEVSAMLTELCLPSMMVDGATRYHRALGASGQAPPPDRLADKINLLAQLVSDAGSLPPVRAVQP